MLGPHSPPGARCPEQGHLEANGTPEGGPALGRPGAGCARALPAAPQARPGTPAAGSRRAGFGDAGAPPPRAAGKAVGLSRQTRESEAEADTWGTFPPRLEFHRKHMHRRSRHGRGRGGNFPLLLAGFGPRSRRSGKAEAPRATPQGRAPALLGEPERGGEGGSPRWIPGRAMGPALPWWFSSGIYILVFSLTIDQKLF